MTPNHPHFVIAIDGPAASGKSTLARNLAKRLNLAMVNSGAMYRAVTWKVIQEGISVTDAPAVIAMLDRIQLDCGHDGDVSTIAVDGVTLGDELRTEEINSNVSSVSAIPEVREKLVGLQRDYLKHTSLVMEGRDIGSVVFSETPYKIYVTACETIRTARREGMGEVDSVAERDAADSGRTTAPLMVAEGAAILDTSHHSIESGVEAAILILRQQGLAI